MATYTASVFDFSFNKGTLGVLVIFTSYLCTNISESLLQHHVDENAGVKLPHCIVNFFYVNWFSDLVIVYGFSSVDGFSSGSAGQVKGSNNNSNLK